MANPVSRAYSAASVTPGPQTPINMDYIPYGTTTIAVVVVSGQATFSVEFTLDDVNNASVTPRWLALTDFPEGSSDTAYSVFHGPMTYIRINLEAVTGSVEFKVAQSSTPRS